MQDSTIEMPQPIAVFNTPLVPTSYTEASQWVFAHPSMAPAKAVDFTNTHIVTMRALDEEFELATMDIDFFIPDSMPLIWVINSFGGKMSDRIYGPKFTGYCLQHSPPDIKHYFLGGSQSCLDNLEKNIKSKNPDLNIVGIRNGYFSADEEIVIIEEIQALAPDCIWLGLGTPKQQAFACKLKSALPSGIILLVGFAFDVNAGTKPDAPMVLQRLGLTWVFRLISEPKRLFPRYMKYNSLFLLLLFKSILNSGGVVFHSRFVKWTLLAYFVQLLVAATIAPGFVAKGSIVAFSMLAIVLAFSATILSMSVRDAVGGKNRMACLSFEIAARLSVLLAWITPIILLTLLLLGPLGK